MAFGSAEALLHLALTGNLIPQITNLSFTITFPALNIFSPFCRCNLKAKASG